MTPDTVTLINEEDHGPRGGRRQNQGRGVCDALDAATGSQGGGKLGEDPASLARPR